MIVTFEQTYLKELYTVGKASDKKQIATICNITELSNHYK